MNYPYPPQPGYGQQPAYQQAPPAQGYAPQQSYAPNTAYTQPGYAPPQQGYAPQQFQQPAPPPVPQGDIDDFYAQPSGSGKAISYTGKQPGYTVSGIVARPVTKADIQPQTDKNNNIGRWRDGRVKYQMIVPLNVTPSPEHPEGMAAWYVKGQSRDELNRAMAEAGRPPNTPPEAGARVDITFTGTRPIPGMSPQNLIQVRYTPPQHAANPTTPTQSATAPAPGPAPVTPAAPATAGAAGYEQQFAQYPPQPQTAPQQFFEQPQWQQPGNGNLNGGNGGYYAEQGPGTAQQFAPETQPPQAQFQAPASYPPQGPQPQEFQQAQAQQPFAPQGPQPPSGLSPEHQALLQQITGNNQ